MDMGQFTEHKVLARSTIDGHKLIAEVRCQCASQIKRAISNVRACECDKERKVDRNTISISIHIKRTKNSGDNGNG